MQAVPNIHFTGGQCAAAVALYEKAFGARIQILLRYGDANDPAYGPAYDELVYHAEIFIGDQRLVMCDHITLPTPAGNTVSIMLSMDTEDRAAAAYGVLAQAATIITEPTRTAYSTYFASLVDRFGVRWELIVERDHV